MIKLKEEELKYISKKKRGLLVKDNESYFFKEAFEDGIELVIERLAKKFDIKCPHYELITIHDKRYYLSRNISEKDEFYTFKDLNINEYTLNGIKNNFASFYPKHYEYLMNQIIKIYLFDILILNPDRRDSNIGIYFKNGNITDVYILDNECAFYKGRKVYFTSKDKYQKNIYLDILDNGIPAIKRNMKELKYFLSICDDNTRKIFDDMYEIISPELVRSLFESIEKEENRDFFMKEEYLRRYSLNYEAIGSILGITR